MSIYYMSTNYILTDITQQNKNDNSLLVKKTPLMRFLYLSQKYQFISLQTFQTLGIGHCPIER